MSKWRAVILVPQVVEIEYANNISAAMKGTMAVMKNLPTVDQHIPKLLEIRGPKGEITIWGEAQKAKLPAVPASGGGIVDKGDDGGDGPAAA